MSEQQTTADVLMIRPASFCANTQTAESNRFQQIAQSISHANSIACVEFDRLVLALKAANIRVIPFNDTTEPQTPDALFPNNWVSFHADGTVVLYPMLAPNRRQERRVDIIDSLAAVHQFRIRRIVDLSNWEDKGKYLEGTGSLVLDRINRIAYACLSPRTHPDVVEEFARELDYKAVCFEASDAAGFPIYHTNVALSVGTTFATICADAIRLDQREQVLGMLRATHPYLLELSHAQMNDFAGNMLELGTNVDGRVVALSNRAAAALTQQQRAQLEQCSGPLVTMPIPTIETLGGGSVRCMLAEIHLPRAATR